MLEGHIVAVVREARREVLGSAASLDVAWATRMTLRVDGHQS